jgi:hypothetical protein
MITCKSINVDCAMSIMRSGPLPPPSPGYPLGKPRNATITPLQAMQPATPAFARLLQVVHSHKLFLYGASRPATASLSRITHGRTRRRWKYYSEKIGLVKARDYGRWRSLYQIHRSGRRSSRPASRMEGDMFRMVRSV